MEKTIERKAMFEEATRCPECYSDKIYVFQDSDGGLCTKCKCLLTGQIKGGISKAELMRLRGEIPTEETVNEKDRKSEEAEKAKLDVAKLKEDMARLNKSQVMSPVKDAPKTPKHEGPSIIEKAKAWLFNPEKPKGAGAVAPKASPPPAAPPAPPIVKAPPVKETGLPMPGELWSVGKCGPCRLDRRYTGKVTRSKAAKSSDRFLEIYDPGTGNLFGCFFCAKKS